MNQKDDLDSMSQTNIATGKIRFSEKFGYGLGDVAVNLSWASVGMFIVYFYTDVIGLSAAVIGTIILLSRFLDGISDILMGVLVDKTKSKHGKARPWILWMSVPFAIFTVLLFTVPDTTNFWQIIYVIITYNLMVLFFTSVVIPYGTLNSLITQDQQGREVINLFRMFLAQVGVLIVSNLTIPLVETFGGGQSGWIFTYVIMGMLSVVIFMITFKTTKERVKPAKKPSNKVPLKESLKTLPKNKYWIIAFFYFIVYSIGYAINQGGNIYYAEYILGSPALVGVLTLAYLLAMMAGLLMMAPLFSKFGKRNTMIVGSIVSIIGCFIIMINPTNLVIVIVAQIVKGLGQASLTGGLWALLPDTIEYGEWKTGVRNEGVLYSGGSMGQKIGNGLGMAFIGWILSWGGYNGMLAVQPDSAITSIYTIFIYLPIVIFAAQIILLYFYKLDKVYPKIVADLEARKMNG